MPKNKVSDLITDQEIAFARLVLSGTMTDRHAAEAVGLNLDSAAYTKSKPRIRAYLLEHRAAVQQQLVEQDSQEQRRLNLDREQVLARLWEIANLSPEMTRGSITGQVKALSMIVAMQNFIPTVPPFPWRKNPRLRPSNRKSMRLPGLIRKKIHLSSPPVPACRGSPIPARRQRRLRTLAQANPPSSTPFALRRHRQRPLMRLLRNPVLQRLIAVATESSPRGKENRGLPWGASASEA